MQQTLPALMSEVAKKMVSQLLEEGGSSSAEEVQAVTSVCMMGVFRTGSEDPRAELRKVSDPLILHLVKNLHRARESKPLAKVSQFFLIEWCFRNGYLEEDWRWEWVSRDEGRMHVKPTMPLEMIPVPTD